MILKLLIQGGGNVNVKDDADLTPLHVIQNSSSSYILFIKKKILCYLILTTWNFLVFLHTQSS